jgi:hypothetical protein
MCIDKECKDFLKYMYNYRKNKCIPKWHGFSWCATYYLLSELGNVIISWLD